ncbi:hypothetical protein PFFVO_00248 [Plasmodium falciparum Vietnam Oak-Knoll (FVO)]|uniref:Uncharacterized protein n=1 Tax=Plasmodium falciparum Vietnam Oak-Knoll (FVO) TaxID=1036723 RepID=A0A024VDM1_PLAFA|nr:hypothetical protein PFFVO_00248 [Plasmodium falciparum Vietnam Oak-Knoll (FVO)]
MNCLTKTFGKFISPIQVIICTSILYLFYKNVGITVFIFNKFEILIIFTFKPYINNIFEK